MISVNHIRKSYGDNVAVDDLSFEVRQGEVLGLLGPNGAGKSTTLLILLGALQPDSGSIVIDGVDSNHPSTRASLGMVPQSLAIYEDLSAEENLRFFGQIYDLNGSSLKTRIDWALQFAGLEDRRKDMVKTYSGGMKRRLNLACGLIHEPKVVFLDEPTVGVDPQSRNHIFDSVENLKKEGLTVIYTTHYMEEAERLCDRVGIIEHGKLLALDTVPNLVKAHGGPSKVIAELTSDKAPDDWKSSESGQYEITTDQPYGEMAKLSSYGDSIVRIQIEEANLETVFLNLTGRSLRD